MIDFYIKLNTGLKWVNIISFLEIKKRVAPSCKKQYIVNIQI